MEFFENQKYDNEQDDFQFETEDEEEELRPTNIDTTSKKLELLDLAAIITFDAALQEKCKLRLDS